MAHHSRRALLGAASLALAGPVVAQDGASRPITIIVPFPAGGSVDAVARVLAEGMRISLGQPVQVENRAGGNTVIGAEYVARARPDGQTLLMAAGTTLTISPVIQPNLPYKVEDFAPVMLVATYPYGILTRVQDGPADVPALIVAARARPGQMTYGSNGPTTTTNVAMLMVLERLGIAMQDVTYRGDPEQLTAFLAGDLDVMVLSGRIAATARRNGQGRLIAWTSGHRLDATPEVPAVGEYATGLEALSYHGLVAPARTPPEVVRRLNAAADAAMRDEHTRTRLSAEGEVLAGGTPGDFAEFLRQSDERWRPVLRRLGVPRN
jgi:tripartite-type tricarboxylate transporter receptor subunit TctC